jgi:ABC-type Na+ transport system ATPase subunit NatA
LSVLEIKNLRKSFGDKEVLCGLSLSVPEHSVFGFIGRNGAGKTTTMKAVLGLLRTDGGEIYVAGEKVAYGGTSTNRYIGYLPDVPEFYGFMTAREYLALCGESLGMSKAEIKERSEELLSLVGLAGEKHRVRGYSRGMKQRLGIAQALFARPKLLICDEPTSALDPVGRKEILDVLLAAREQLGKVRFLLLCAEGAYKRAVAAVGDIQLFGHFKQHLHTLCVQLGLQGPGLGIVAAVDDAAVRARGSLGHVASGLHDQDGQREPGQFSSAGSTRDSCPDDGDVVHATFPLRTLTNASIIQQPHQHNTAQTPCQQRLLRGKPRSTFRISRCRAPTGSALPIRLCRRVLGRHLAQRIPAIYRS